MYLPSSVVAVLIWVSLRAGIPLAASSCTDCDGGNVTCVDGVCLPRCVNVTSSGECLQCRDSGFYGHQCEVCPEVCINSTCHQINSRVECTIGCVAGRKGDKCEVDCPPSCTQCERYDDRCVGRCSSPTFYGYHCDKTCPPNCLVGCNSSNGECASCRASYRGRYCNESCPPYCKEGCDKDTGTCGDCVTGYTGRYCGIVCEVHTGHCSKCIDGKRGEFCNEPCPPNCAQCDRYSGSCIGPCPGKGVYGRNCSFPCSLSCDGCEKETGVCIECAPGYSRMYCDEMCSLCAGSGGNCDSKNCKTRDSHLLLKVILGSLAVIIVLVLASSLQYYRYRKPITHGKLTSTVDAGPSDQSQYWSTKYYEINEDDVDSCSFRNNIPPPLGQSPPPVQHGRNYPQVSLEVEDYKALPVSDSARTGSQVTDSSRLSDADSTMGNQLYTSDETGVDVGDRVSTSSCRSEDTRGYGNKEIQASQVYKHESDCSVKSDDLRLSRISESTVTWDLNSDLSKVNVRYITPNVPDNSRT